MNNAIIRTVTSDHGSIHIEATHLQPGVEVEVHILPIDPIARYGLKRCPLPRVEHPFCLEGDAVAIQRRMRQEWRA